MQPLRIDWRLSRPVVTGAHAVHLDALLAWARVQEAGGDWSVQHDLPLARAEHDGQWCFQASIVVFKPTEAMRLVHMVRRTDPTQIALDGAYGALDLRQSEINTGSGPLKGYSWHMATQFCDSARAWCVGDLERVTELLGRVRSLGKLARNSFGEVAEFEVTPTPENEVERWTLRAYPAEFESSGSVAAARAEGVEFALAQGRVHPPYWGPDKSVVLEPIGWAA